MKLTEFILNVGRPVAYYPNLRKITGSVTSTIMLCQFLYWSDKTRDGWIYKTSSELEEETGLTYYEQKTAKENLERLGLIEYEFKRLDHTTRFRINKWQVNKMWEDLGEGSEEAIEAISPVPEIAPEESPEEWFDKHENPKPSVPSGKNGTKPEKKGDLVDGLLAATNSRGHAKMVLVNEIRALLEKKFHINTENKKWNDFIEFMYLRKTKHGEEPIVFIEWALSEGFSPIYWTPEKMKTLYPQAYIMMNEPLTTEGFVEKLPERKEEVYVPMPKNMGRKRETY